MKKIFLALCTVLLLTKNNGYSQSDSLKISDLNQDDIAELTYEQLLAIPFDKLIKVAENLGMSIDELLKAKTSVASKTALTPRETPGIISIVTENEIKNSGARDLIDVLRLVPGINFGYDDEGVIGIQMRGNWALEGKVLLIIDGIEFNELMYNNLEFGNHFDVSQIKRIEIIRGPGSSIYGGNAELGVINITTKKGNDIKGIAINASSGYMTNTLGYWNGGLQAGKRYKDWDISLKTFIGEGIRTNSKFQYIDTTTYDLSKKGAETKTMNVNLGINNKKLFAQFIYDDYTTGYVYDSAYAQQYFRTLAGNIRYEFKVTDKLTITPKIDYRNSIPFNETGYYLNCSINRLLANTTISYNPKDNINIIGGVEYFTDNGKILGTTDSSLFNNGKRTVSYNTVSGFIQGIMKTHYANITAGIRYDMHNVFGSAFAPRIGITKCWDKFHAKILYSEAFRSPSIGNLTLTPSTRPEHTHVTEAEVGYKINKNMFVTANVFNIKIDNPIIYFSDSVEGYKTFNHTGTQGFELEYRIKYSKLFASLNYSFYAVNSNKVIDYRVEPNLRSLVGAPQNKITCSGGYTINDITVSPSVIYIGERYLGQHYNYAKENADVLINLNVVYNNFLTQNLNASIGVYDILNTKSAFIQSYSGLQRPYPGASREFVFKLNYLFGL
jgi:outer membrane cobalamin receptor